MASITKQANGKYRARVYAGRDENGKILYRSITVEGQKECKKAARLLEQEIEEGRLVNLDNIRLVSWIKEYMEINKSSYAPSTRSLYQSYLDNHYEPYFKNMKMKQINEIHIKKFKNHLLSKMQASSARRILSALKKILKECLKDKSPARDVPLPKANKPSSKAPTTEEFMMIHKAAKGTNFEIPILLAGWCGFRRGEIFALRVGDIDLKNNKIRIDEGVSKNEENIYEFGPPKSENGYRVEVAPKYLMDLIKGILPRSKKVVELKSKADQLLFKGRPDNFSSAFGEWIADNELPDYRFHDLRHYHATWLFDNDVPDKYAAKRMGHSLEMLKEVYQHLGLEKQKELEDKIMNIDKTAH